MRSFPRCEYQSIHAGMITIWEALRQSFYYIPKPKTEFLKKVSDIVDLNYMESDTKGNTKFGIV
jgi:hypothetical protein